MELPCAQRWDEINDLLVEAASRPADERSAFLDEACTDAAVREDLEALLAADAAHGDLFEQGAADLARPLISSEANEGEPAPRLEAGRQVGPYRILERIGEGGTSTVYRAERTDDQFERAVAVKVLRGVMGKDEQAAERFRAERQILASLSHPHIAEVYGGGVLADGRPYLVMELVDGHPITEYCRKANCSLDERLDLFRQAAAAVQAAHEQLVVHRDLKPSNVLVERNTGRVKLLDFGIAKMLGDLPGTTPPTTRTGRRPMTPAYAAPEQVKGDSIGVATDLYALGVLLYELLAEAHPYGRGEQSPYAVARAVCEEDPPPPSEAISNEEGRTALQGDLDAIVMKAVRTDPEARYDTVDEFLDDLGRYRTDRPIHAQRGGWTYQTRKFVRRHHRGLAGSLAAVMLLISFAGYHLWRLSTERDRARREAETAEQVTQYLADLLEQADPTQTQGEPTTARDLLRMGTQHIDELREQPTAQAELAYVLGKTRRRLGLYDSTRVLLEKALAIRRQNHGREHAEVAAVLSELALLARDRDGHYAKAESLFAEAASIYRATLGPRDEAVSEELTNLVYVRRKQGELKEAEEAVREALSIQRAQYGTQHMSVAETLFNLAAILKDRGQLEKAERIQRRSLELCRRLTEGPHPGTAANLDALALLLKKQGQSQAAEQMYRKALAIKRALYGSQHTKVATTHNNLAESLQAQERLAAAETHLRKALQIRRAVYESPHPQIAISLGNLGEVLHKRGQPAGADSVFWAARTMLRKTGKRGTPIMAYALEKHGTLLRDRGAYPQAQAAYRNALTIRRSMHDAPHPTIKELRSDLVSLYREWGKPDQAALHRDTLMARYKDVSSVR